MKNRRSLLKAGAAALLSLALLTGCMPVEEEILMPKLSEPAPISYATATVQRGTVVKKISGQGSFKTRKTYTLSFPISGIVAKSVMTAYSSVKKGDLLLVLEEADTLKLELSKAERNVVVAQNEMDRLQKEAEGGGQIELLKLQWEQEAQRLATMSGASESELKAQQIKTDLAKATYETALEQAKNDYAVAQADYKTSVAERDLKKERYDACFLYAPVSGVITWVDRNKYTVGASVNAYDEVLTISDGANAYLTYSGDASSIPYMGVGTELTIQYQENEYAARVIQDPTTTPPDANYGAPFVWFFEVPELDLTKVHIGDTAAFTLILDKRENVLVVDSYLITVVNGVSTVKTLVDGYPVTRPVEVGLEGTTQVEIISGLEEGDQIIIS